MKKYFILFFLVILSSLQAQKDTLEYFPAELNIHPFSANFLEPRLGSDFEIGNNKLWLNIGNSVDLLHYNFKSRIISLGADLFTWTRLRSTKNFKFPVETVDYLFGINAGYKKINNAYRYGMRLRISHISAHLIDGQYDLEDEKWQNDHKPFIYSREFIDILGFYKKDNLKTYLGGIFVFHTIPDELGMVNIQTGLEYFWKNALSEDINLFAAYDFKLVDILKYHGNNSLKAGIKFGKPFGKGFSVHYNYYSGKSIHGMFYNLDRNYHSVGLNLDI